MKNVLSARRLAGASMLLLVGVGAGAQQPASPAAKAKDAAVPALSTRLPVDAKVRTGTLTNGLRYYIRRNARPEKRAELRLVVNAGSILEPDDAQSGAHMLEHTAFNGTKHFARNDLIKYLESIGVRFGADLNAITSFDETIYILPVPTDTARLVEQAFTILEDWAHGQTFDSVEVMNERAVVREEWRGSKGAGERLMRQWLPVVFRGSRYAERLPVAHETSIMAMTPAKLRKFYRDWYRPDLMAVVAVGDFNPATIETLIRKHFGGIRKPAGPLRRPVYDVPANAAPLIAIAHDKEATSSAIQLSYKLPATPTRTVRDFRTSLMAQLYLRALNGRFAEIVQKPDAPFLVAQASKNNFFARNLEVFTLFAGVKDGSIERGLEALLLEAKRVDQFGFLQSELDRTKQIVLREVERAYAEREKTSSDAFVNEYIAHFLRGEAIPGVEYEYDLARKLLPTITLDEVNGLASRWITDSNRVIVAITPEKPGVAIPTEAGILSVFDRSAGVQLAAWTESLSSEALLDHLPSPGRITGERTIAGIGATEWTLSNGARVIFKPTDFKQDEVAFAAYSPGGTSLATDADFMSATLSQQVIPMGGLGTFKQTDLQKKLAGKAVKVTPVVSPTTEGLNGSASPKDLETLFQLIHLTFTAPRVDSVAFTAFQNQVGPFLANRSLSPEQVFQDTVQVTMSQHDYRARPLSPAVFSEVDLEKALRFYRDRYSDAGDFTFVFVGNVSATSLRPFVEQYLASLPSSGRKEKARVVGNPPPKGVVQKTVRKGSEPKAATTIIFTGACTYDPGTRLQMRALTTLMQMRLLETLREKLGGTYSANAIGSCNREPRQEYSVAVQYQSSPENVDALSAAVMSLVDSLQATPASAADVERVKEQILRTREVELKQNMYWVQNIIGRDQSGEDLAGLLAPYEAMVKGLTAEQIRESARRFLGKGNYARFVLLPETQASP